MLENDECFIGGVNITRSGIMRLPEQMPSNGEGKKRKRVSIEEKLSEEFRGLIDRVDDYMVLITEDFKTARLIFAHALNYETNISIESAFLGHAYALSKGKKAEFWIEAGAEKEFRGIYEDFMENYLGIHYKMNIVECNGWKKHNPDVVEGLRKTLLG